MSRHLNLAIVGTVLLWGNGLRAELPDRCRRGEAEVWRSVLWLRSEPPARGVALLIHGLNQTPAATNPLAVELNNMGIDVLRLTLHGHGGRAEARGFSLAQVDADLWLHEALCAYEQLRAEAVANELPAFLVAFSLGALVGTALVSSGPKHVSFDRMVLLAPALRTHWYVRSVRVFAPWPRMVVPSVAPAHDRANDGTPIAAYEALFALEDRMVGPLGGRLNVPTLVLVDEEDEVVSAAAIREMIAEHGLYRWVGACVVKGEDATSDYHHTLTRPAHVGRATWAVMVERMRAHLLAK